MNDRIIVRGARENNLKNVDVSIPRDKMVVFTGLSGSGKSSLAFDTIYAEGQRRYVESLSSYARQFLGQMDKPDVDSIDGLSPAISIDQKTTSKNPRSTVGTVTEIYDYLRLLWARVGHAPLPQVRQGDQQTDHRPDCGPGRWPCRRGHPVSWCCRRSSGARRASTSRSLRMPGSSGFVRVRVDGILYDLTEEIKLEKNKKHTIELVVDRLVLNEGLRRRLTDSIETACARSGGLVIIQLPKEDAGADLLPELRLRGLRHQPDGAGAPDVLLQQSLRRLPQLHRPGLSADGRSGAGHPGQGASPSARAAIQASGWQSARTDSIARMYFEALAQKYHFSLDGAR